MAESIEIIKSLKKAANYTKLGMRDLGPKSFKKGQGALIKVLYKFSDEGALCKKKLEKVLGWRGKELRRVAEKAEKNGYVTIADPQFKFEVSLTEKGTEVIKKRLSAEDRAADAILEGLTDEERQQLLTISAKISKTCEELGIDYSEIKKRRGGKHCGHGKGCGRHGHGHGPEGHGKGCHHGHGHGSESCKRHGHGHGSHGAPEYVFVFGEGGHRCCK